MKRLVLLIVIAALMLPNFAGAFSVSPAIIELAGGRGQSVTSQVVVRNTSATAQTYYLETRKFVAREDSGSPTFISRDVDHSGLPDWIALSKTQVTLNGQSQATIPFTVAVPADVASGSYNAAIVISSSPFTATGGSTIQASTAVLVLFTVTGETVAKAALLDFGPVGGSILPSASGSFRYRVQNQGNVFVTPRGSVSVKDMFGRVLAEADANADGSRVLPGMTRTYEGSFQSSLFVLGPASVVLKLTYADDAPALVGSYSFWVLPVIPMALAAVVLACLALVFVIRRFTRSAS